MLVSSEVQQFINKSLADNNKASNCTFPAKMEHVALYLQHPYSIMDSAIYALQWAHNLARLPSPIDASIIRDISKAAKKMNVA